MKDEKQKMTMVQVTKEVHRLIKIQATNEGMFIPAYIEKLVREKEAK